MRPSRPCVYFVRCEATELVKIGFTTGYPDERVSTLQVGSAGRLSLIEGFIVANRAHEMSWHQVFAKYRRHGEWFDLDVDQVTSALRNYEAITAHLQLADRPLPHVAFASAVAR